LYPLLPVRWLRRIRSHSLVHFPQGLAVALVVADGPEEEVVLVFCRGKKSSQCLDRAERIP
jgi:hypothetical protein